LEALIADQDDALVPRADRSVPPRGGWITSPLQSIARQHDGARDQPVGAALIITANVDEQRALRLFLKGFGRRRAVR
jgi:hypothetical protein